MPAPSSVNVSNNSIGSRLVVPPAGSSIQPTEVAERSDKGRATLTPPVTSDQVDILALENRLDEVDQLVAMELEASSASQATIQQRNRALMMAAYHGIRVASVVLGAYWILLFVGTHLPKVAMPSIQQSDKVLHLGAFGGLAFLLAWAIPTNWNSPMRNVLWAGLIAICYGAIDEGTQTFVPGRTADWYDLLADSIGVALGLMAYIVARRIYYAFRPTTSVA